MTAMVEYMASPRQKCGPARSYARSTAPRKRSWLSCGRLVIESLGIERILIMTTALTTADDRLANLRIHLPDAPTPFGPYVPAVQTGNLLFLSGMLATSGHTARVTGVVGKDLDVKAGREAAHTAALNVLALTKKRLGSLDRVTHVVRLGVYVAAT